MADLDIIIPVYNERHGIISVLDAFRKDIKTSFRVLICYDFDEDDTLEALKEFPDDAMEIILVKNPGSGPHSAVRAGFSASTAPAVLVFMADDDYNVPIIDDMVSKFNEGCDVVAASRFVEDGNMVGCPWFKALVTRTGAFLMHSVVGMPVHDATNAFRLFSRRLLDTVEIESRVGFTFSVELLVKAVRLGWKVDEVAAKWYERSNKPSRFRVLKWLPAYIRWLVFAAASWRGPSTVRRRDNAPQ